MTVSDVVLIRDGDGYRIVFGRLRLVETLSRSNELLVDVKGSGQALVFKACDGSFLVNIDDHQLPLFLI